MTLLEQKYSLNIEKLLEIPFLPATYKDSDEYYRYNLIYENTEIKISIHIDCIGPLRLDDYLLIKYNNNYLRYYLNNVSGKTIKLLISNAEKRNNLKKLQEQEAIIGNFPKELKDLFNETK